MSHPIQYQAPLFRALASSPNLEFQALFGSDHGVVPSFDPGFGRQVDFGIPLLDGYQSTFLPQAAAKPSIDRFTGLRIPLGVPFFGRMQPDVAILHGWRTLMMWQAAATCRARRIPYMVRAETPDLPSAHQATSLRRIGRDLAVKRLLRGATAVLSLGAANDRFYERMGVDSQAITRVPYFVDNVSVREAAMRGASRRAELRAAHDVPQHARLVIGVGKLLPRKRPNWIVELMPSLADDVHLMWIGAGEIESDLRAQISQLGLGARVHMPGFAQSPAAWELMGASDLFVCPSVNEPWGLVINEAVAAGLPAVVSDQCGASEDLVRNGVTGTILRPDDRAAWLAAIDRWTRPGAADPDAVRAMRERADAHALEVAVAAIAHAAHAAASGTV